MLRPDNQSCDECTVRRQANAELGDDMVRHPGKFEGEQGYVPYLWEQDQPDDILHDDDGRVTLVFRVDDDMRQTFAGLDGVQEVHLYEDEQGFVREVTR
jgi:hypothetical protein